MQGARQYRSAALKLAMADARGHATSTLFEPDRVPERYIVIMTPLYCKSCISDERTSVRCEFPNEAELSDGKEQGHQALKAWLCTQPTSCLLGEMSYGRYKCVV